MNNGETLQVPPEIPCDSQMNKGETLQVPPEIPCDSQMNKGETLQVPPEILCDCLDVHIYVESVVETVSFTNSARFITYLAYSGSETARDFCPNFKLL